jgi:predicted PurR-regulated permease PerM
MVPFTIAALLSFLLAPLCDGLEQFKLGRIPAVLVTAIFAFALIGFVVWTVAAQLNDVANKLPEYEENITTRLNSVSDYVHEAMRKISRTSEQIGRISKPEESNDSAPEERPYPVRIITPLGESFQFAGQMAGTVVEVLCTVGVVIVFVGFFLMRREDLRDRFIRLVGRGQVTVTTQALNDAAGRVSQYLAMQLLINASFGLAVATGLYFIGIPNAILWGLLATALRFVPYMGAWIAAAIPILLSLAISTDWRMPTSTVALFVVLELIINNVLEPWLYGARTGVSPVAVLAAAVFWTWLWGGAGLLLATPLTVCLAVLGKYVPQLSFLDVLLGDQPVFDEKTRIYQRLLAGDPEEATELVRNRFEESSLVEVYDNMLLPALNIAEQERHNGELDEFRHKFVCGSLRDLTDELADWQQERRDRAGEASDDASKSDLSRIVPNGLKLSVLSLPARDAADEIAGMMLAKALEFSGICAEAVSVTALASEMMDEVARHSADVVCISAMPPAAVTHARYLCKRLHARFPAMPLVVGLWNARGDLKKAQERIACGESVRVVAKIADALEQVRSLAQPRLVQNRTASDRDVVSAARS